MTRKPSAPDQNKNNWKDKYLDALDEQEQRDQQYRHIKDLLIKAVVHISLMADGVDQQLDKQMAGIRKLLRDGSIASSDLNKLVDTMAGQVKRLEIVKGERAGQVAEAFQSLTEQLQKLKPERDASKKLQALQKHLATRSRSLQQYPALINDYAVVQQAVLTERNIQRVSKPFWHSWTSESSDEQDLNQADLTETHPFNKPTTPELEKELHSTVVNDGLDLADDVAEPLPPIDSTTVGEEPPFSRLNQAVCAVLSELLKQIEPPPMAKENYQAASQQISQGLNWYELVPTLENISIVVVSAFDQNQKEFEGFLTQLNQRLEAAYQFINASGQANGESSDASRLLSETMREQVNAMQQSVADATELDQLKTTVSSRLDKILGAMDRFQNSEQQRETTLSDQLNALVEQVKNMEADSQQAEKRIEEQRQKALRDVLTQLPNREAYQLRLEQEHQRWQRYGRPLTMAVCDIDHFKRINDSYGHLAGDKVLRIIAKTLSKRLRKTDFIARFGGEEFVILMPETTQEDAFNVVEGVREAIANCPFHFKEQRVTITMSFGVSEFIEGDQGEKTFARCDKALYQAKDQGRNQSVLASQ